MASGEGGSRVAMSDETRGSDAAAPSGGDARDDYMSAMDSFDGAARARKRRREAEDASGVMDETMGGDDEGGGDDGDGDGSGSAEPAKRQRGEKSKNKGRKARRCDAAKGR